MKVGTNDRSLAVSCAERLRKANVMAEVICLSHAWKLGRAAYGVAVNGKVVDLDAAFRGVATPVPQNVIDEQMTALVRL